MNYKKTLFLSKIQGKYRKKSAYVLSFITINTFMAQFCMNSVLITAFLFKIETAQRSRQGSGDGSYVDLKLLQRVDLLRPLISIK